MSFISKNVYIDKLDHIVNKYNNTYHGTNKMKPVDIKSMIKILNLKLVILLEYQNMIIFLQKAMVQTSFKNLETLSHGQMLLVILKAKKSLERFTKNNCKKTNQEMFTFKKVIKKTFDKLYVKWKSYDSSFNSWIDKKRHSINVWIFPEPKSLGGRVKVELDLSNYSRKADLKYAAGVDTSQSAKKVDLDNLKTDVDK